MQSIFARRLRRHVEALLACAGACAVATVLTSCRIPPLQAVPDPGITVASPENTPAIPAPDPAAAWVPRGFRAEIAVRDLTYPTSVEFDDAGNLFIAESGYVYGDAAAPARIFRISPGGNVEIVAENLNGPVTDLLWFNDALYISHRGKISLLQSAGEVRDLVTDLPSLGDHHNNQMAVGPDGWIYFGQGTATNSGVVGVDNFVFGWLQHRPKVHDIPARDIEIRGREYITLNPLVLAQQEEPPLVRTGPFAPFGEGAGGTRREGSTRANGTILRMRPDGSQLQVHAWGLRNPFGIAWSPDGRLFAADNAYDDRGSRPVANAPDVLWRIEPGAWYGWPDFVAGRPITDPRFRPEGKSAPQFLMADHPPVEQPAMIFGKHAAVTKMAFGPPRGHPSFGGFLYMAQFGDMTPVTGRQVDEMWGRRVVRIDLQTGEASPFFQTRPESLGPTLLEHVETAGPKRPVDVVFAPGGDAMYVVDMGAFMVLPTATPMVRPFPATGVVWRIVPDDAPPSREPTNISVIPPRASGEPEVEDSRTTG
jgi:glucose/arabinose dehydrogenase